ncbi:MAG: ribosomal L7Ae/L30e/S12e/Gadd45 family protein [Clostridia bacterium]|nr:ribosomal L7Ae/L30e/S12e/Gadd45 family protein [Clostridia bacterium]
MVEKALRMLGLATRAGKVITGAELVTKALKNNKIHLIILANDAKESTAKLFVGGNVPKVILGDKETLGKMTGKEIRSVVGITDKNFAEVILKEAGNSNVTEN